MCGGWLPSIVRTSQGYELHRELLLFIGDGDCTVHSNTHFFATIKATIKNRGNIREEALVILQKDEASDPL
jgi:hypothetical protein